MADHLARIIGTEEDRVNCPFYWKIGACRHGDQCSRSHYKPTCSQTLILRHMYQNPPVALAIAEGQNVSDDLADQAQDHFEAFFEEVFEELANYGQLEEMVVCDNVGDHMIGNVYVKYTSEDDAEKAALKLKGRFYAGRVIEVEFSPVTDFREARCRQFVDGQCTRGGYCNFMHMKHIPRSLKRRLMRRMFQDHPDYKEPPPSYDERRYDRGGDPRGRHNDHRGGGGGNNSMNHSGGGGGGHSDSGGGYHGGGGRDYGRGGGDYSSRGGVGMGGGDYRRNDSGRNRGDGRRDMPPNSGGGGGGGARRRDRSPSPLPPPPPSGGGGGGPDGGRPRPAGPPPSEGISEADFSSDGEYIKRNHSRDA